MVPDLDVVCSKSHVHLGNLIRLRDNTLILATNQILQMTLVTDGDLCTCDIPVLLCVIALFHVTHICMHTHTVVEDRWFTPKSCPPKRHIWQVYQVLSRLPHLCNHWQCSSSLYPYHSSRLIKLKLGSPLGMGSIIFSFWCLNLLLSYGAFVPLWDI